MHRVPNGLTPKLVSLAHFADRLQVEVEGGRSAKTLVDGSTFDAFFTAGSAFAKAFDKASLDPPSSGDPAGESFSLPSQIGFTSVSAPGTEEAQVACRRPDVGLSGRNECSSRSFAIRPVGGVA